MDSNSFRPADFHQSNRFIVAADYRKNDSYSPLRRIAVRVTLFSSNAKMFRELTQQVCLAPANRQYCCKSSVRQLFQ